MLNQEQLTKDIKLITQNAWRRDTATTLNDMIEFIVREALFKVLEELNPMLESLTDRLDTLELKETKHASKNGRLPQPQGSTEVLNETRRGRPAKAGG